MQVISVTVPSPDDTVARAREVSQPAASEIVKEAVSSALHAVKEELQPLISQLSSVLAPSAPSFAEVVRRTHSRSWRHNPGNRSVAPATGGVRPAPFGRHVKDSSIEFTAEERGLRFQKSLNLRIRGLISEEDAPDDDGDKVTALLSALPVQLNQHPIDRFQRFSREGQSPVLIITLKTAKDRDDILRGKSSLREGPFTSVYIGRDLTRLQAQWEYERRCRRRQQQMETSQGESDSFVDATTALPGTVSTANSNATATTTAVFQQEGEEAQST